MRLTKRFEYIPLKNKAQLRVIIYTSMPNSRNIAASLGPRGLTVNQLDMIRNIIR